MVERKKNAKTGNRLDDPGSDWSASSRLVFFSRQTEAQVFTFCLEHPKNVRYWTQIKGWPDPNCNVGGRGEQPGDDEPVVAFGCDLDYQVIKPESWELNLVNPESFDYGPKIKRVVMGRAQKRENKNKRRKF